MLGPRELSKRGGGWGTRIGCQQTTGVSSQVRAQSTGAHVTDTN